MSLLGFLLPRPTSSASVKAVTEAPMDQSPPLTPSLSSSSSHSSDPTGLSPVAVTPLSPVDGESEKPKSRPLPTPPTSAAKATSQRERPPRQGRPTSLTRPLTLVFPAPARPQDGPPTAFKYKLPQARLSSSSLFHDGHHSSLFTICSRHTILGALLVYLDFSDFQSMSCTSRNMRTLLGEVKTRDAILSRFVPSYRSVYSRKLDAIPLSMVDLEVLMMSQTTPLHLYPMHALRVVNGAPATPLTMQLEVFTQTHSRFVLLLRSRAPPAPAPLENDDIQWRLPYMSEMGSVRQVNFPAPLSYFPPTPPASPKETSRRNKKQRRSSSIFCLFSKPPSSAKVVDEQSHAALSSPTFSLFRTVKKPRVPPPPPERVPTAMRQHRTQSRMMSNSLSIRRGQTPMSMLKEIDEDSTEILTPPRPFHLRSHSLPTSTASNSSQSFPRYGTLQSSPTVTSNPHDITMASVRSRAPVLRVFVPCETLSHSTLLACEGQLMTAGLWEFLNVGDIVSNFGYVPRPDPNASFESQSLESRGWLLYNGTSLLPYEPSVAPEFNALTLSSPLYFAHILPPFINPRFTLRIPVNKSGIRREPELTLTQMTVSVRSPATRTGVVMVNKFAWYGKLDAAELFQVFDGEQPARGRSELNARRSRFGLSDEDHGSSFFSGSDIGEGWITEWMVEAEGTKEGRKELYMALNPFEEVNTEWEIVREKCTPSRIWLRYTPAFIGSDSVEEDGFA